MCILSIMIALGALLPMAPALLTKCIINDPVGKYLEEMCLPLWSNHTRAVHLNLTIIEMASSLSNSPFPCEQEIYIQSACSANGTTEIDFLAEQECICKGAFFDVIAGCDACYAAHGYESGRSLSEESAGIASLSAAECQPSPPFQPLSNLIAPVNITSVSLRPSLTLGDDRFPNNTAVNDYWTPTRSITLGDITGSATARLTTWTNFSGVRYTPTSIPPISGITSPPSTSTSTGSSVATSSSTTASGNVAAGKEVQAAGGLFAVALGVAVLL